MDEDENGEDVHKLFERVMRFISKSNQGRLSKVFYI